MGKPNIHIIVHFVDGKEIKLIWEMPEFENMVFGRDYPKPTDNFVEIPTNNGIYVFNWREIRYIEIFEDEEA